MSTQLLEKKSSPSSRKIASVATFAISTKRPRNEEEPQEPLKRVKKSPLSEGSDNVRPKGPVAEKSAVKSTTKSPFSPSARSSSVTLKRLKVFNLSAPYILKVVREFHDPSLAVQVSANQYLTPILRSLDNTNLRFPQTVPKHCTYVVQRTVSKGGAITEIPKLREGGSNNDHPRFV
jgi:hypothetical protein